MVDLPVTRWAASGAMALTGTPERPLGPPTGLIGGIDRWAGMVPGTDPLSLLGERAASMGLARRGPISCGGSCRLFEAGDEWVAVSLPRQEDRELVPAWLELRTVPASEPALWAAVEEAVTKGSAEAMVARARLLGLPVTRVGETEGPGVVAHPLGPAAARATEGALVIDLSALWAGPLCGDLLARAGADVVKVESTARPDGARRGPAAFFDLLNGRKRSVALDFGSARDRTALRRLIGAADVVIEASRPRALRQLGMEARAIVAAGGPQVWLSITAFGREGDAASRVGFGDDAAAGGGLVVWTEGRPMFCADAVADPLSGLTAADACLRALAEGGRWLVDVSMAGVAAGLSGPTLPVPREVWPAEPRTRPPGATAPDMGADTGRVLAELGI